MKTIFKRSLALLALAGLFQSNASCVEYQVANLTIKSIRYVGEYSDPVFRDTVELWFTTPFSSSSRCPDTRRVYISASHRHMVAGAQIALALNRPVTITVDDALTIRAGSCEVVYFDVPSS